jgi:uncharacterized membrane protein (DUF2068 family)
MRPKLGLRVIALVEAAKGLLVLTAGFGMLALLHQDVQAVAEQLVERFHFNPAREVPRIFIEAAAALNDSTIEMLAIGAGAYAALRLVEGWGLWRERLWAEWLAALSGAIYLPFEIFALSRGTTWPKITLLLVNTAIVVYLMAALYRRSRQPPSPERIG